MLVSLHALLILEFTFVYSPKPNLLGDFELKQTWSLSRKRNELMLVKILI
jgi:hypothetical protein